MTKEELVEMINSTINTNGSGAITGEALNLALQAIVETMGTGSGSGAERLQGYFNGSAWVQTDEEKALNAQLYAKITTALANDEPISVWCIVKAEDAVSNMSSVSITAPGGQMIILFLATAGMFIVMPVADGSITARIAG